MTLPRPLDADFQRYSDAIRAVLDNPNRPLIEADRIQAGTISGDRIQAGTIPDPDGSLAMLTDQLVADIHAANLTEGALPGTTGDVPPTRTGDGTGGQPVAAEPPPTSRP